VRRLRDIILRAPGGLVFHSLIEEFFKLRVHRRYVICYQSTFSGSGSSDGAEGRNSEKLSPSKLSELTSPSPGPSNNSYSLLQNDNVSNSKINASSSNILLSSYRFVFFPNYRSSIEPKFIR